KSRLLHEFRQKIGRDRAFILQGNCSPDGKQTPFLPFIEIVRGSFRIKAGDAEKDVAEKLETGLNALGLSTPQNRGLLLNLLGLKPPEESLSGLDGVLIGLRTRELFQSLLAARCAMSAVAMIVEDLHWIDSVSEEVLGNLVGAGASLPLLVLVTRRPEYVPSWLDRPEVTRLILSPLLDAAVGQLVSSRLGVAQLPSELAKLITDRAEGNALFAEEIVSFLIERGVLQTAAGTLGYDAAAVAAAMPASVQSLLTSRVDRLVPEDRTLLQAASVIGRRFTPELLAAVVPDSGDMQSRLDAMSRLDLVYPDGRSGDYVFKHALIRDALYQSLLTAPRTALHLKLAKEIERRSANRLVEVAETLAHHYSQTDHDRKAFTFLVMAGAKSLGIYSLDDARARFEGALALLDKNPDCAPDTVIADFFVGYSLLLTTHQHITPLIRLVERYAHRIEKIREDRRWILIRHHYVFALLWNCRYRDAQIAQRETLSAGIQFTDDRSKAYLLAAEIQISSIVDPKPLDQFEKLKVEALAAAVASADSYIQNWMRFVIGWEEFHRGRLLEARESARELIRAGENSNDPRSMGMGIALFGWIAIVADAYDEALSLNKRSLMLAITPWDRNAARNGIGICEILLRQLKDGRRDLVEFRSECLSNGCLYPLVGSDGVLGVGTVLEGDIGGGVREIEAAIVARENEGYRTAADWYRIMLCDVYLEILTGKEKPPFKVLLRNLRTLFRLMFTAAAQVEKLAGEVRMNQHFHPNGHHIGHIEMVVGLLFKFRKKRDEARRHLMEAQRIESQFGATPMLNRIESALSEL